MSDRDYILFLEDILESTKKIIKYCDNKSFDEFRNDELLVDGTIRNLEVIGEAVKNLPDKIKNRNANLDWRKIAGIRDILIHDYFGIDYDILWDIVRNKIPILNEQISSILDKEKTY